MKTLSIQRPVPSIEMWIPASVSTSVKGQARELAALVGIEDLPEVIGQGGTVNLTSPGQNEAS